MGYKWLFQLPDSPDSMNSSPDRSPRMGPIETDELIRSIGPLLRKNVRTIQRSVPAAQCAVQAAALQRCPFRRGFTPNSGPLHAATYTFIRSVAWVA